jgi:hypothetical protein
VECDTRIPRSRRQIAVDDDQERDARFYSVSPWSSQGESLFQIMRKPKHLPTIWRLSFSRLLILRS